MTRVINFNHPLYKLRCTGTTDNNFIIENVPYHNGNQIKENIQMKNYEKYR